MILLLIADTYTKSAKTKIIATGMTIGILIAFIGGIVYVFFDPVVHGAGYFIVGIGFIVIAATAVIFIQGLRQVANEEEMEILLRMSQRIRSTMHPGG